MVVTYSSEGHLLGMPETEPHSLLEDGLIALESEDIVGSLRDDLRGYLPLASHGIYRHDCDPKSDLRAFR